MNYYLKKIIFFSICYFFVFNFQVSFSQEEQEKANFTGNKFNAIEIDETDSTYIWFGTNAGIIKYNRTDKKWDYPKNNLLNVNTIITDPYEKNYIWIGTDNSINKYDRTTDKIEIIKIKLALERTDTTFLNNNKFDSTISKKTDSTFIFFNSKVNSIVIDKIDKNNIWAATYTGLLKYNHNTDKWIQYTKKDGLQDNKINIIAIDNINPDIIWIGTEQGISLYRRSKSNVIFESLFLPGSSTKISVYSIEIDGMYVLFGTSEGLHIYNKKSKTWNLFSEDMKNGFPKDKVFSIEVDRNRPSYVWFGTQRQGVLGYDKLANLWHKFDYQKNMRISYILSDPIEKEIVWCITNVCTGGGVMLYNRDLNRWYITEPIINLIGDLEYRWKVIE